MMFMPFTLRIGNRDDLSFEFGQAENLYICKEYNLTVHVDQVKYGDVTAQTITCTNNADEPLLITSLSSARMATEYGQIAECFNRWQAEGQWRFFDMNKVALAPSCAHDWDTCEYAIRSVGSWSTAARYPLSMVLTEKKAYFMEIEGANSWQMRHICTGGLDNPTYLLEASAADESLAWQFTLQPNQSYTTKRAVFGCVDGGFEEAVQALTAYKRTVSRANLETIPVVFNDYMNCLWGAPSDAKLMPLIDAAADVGAEIFCIDAGWYAEAGEWGSTQGDWIPANLRFGEKGLQGILDSIMAKGMKPGVWFELDKVVPTAKAHDIEDGLLTRRNEVIPYNFFDMRNENVRRHLKDRVAALYDMGVRYIKNDYNRSIGLGVDKYGDSLAEGLRKNSEAFLSLIDEIRAAHPDLIIENCASGGGRADNDTLRHFHLQSTSDQERYELYPSILIGSLAFLPPEKAGIWSYPYPVSFAENRLGSFPYNFINRFVDGRQTVFNMVSGMCGLMYLSGRIDLADEHNQALIKEGITFYKGMREHIKSAHPIFPNGTFSMYEKGFACVGLEAHDKESAYLAVWRIEGEESDAVINMSKYGYDTVVASYPTDARCHLIDGKLFVKLEDDLTACMMKLSRC
jgi:alpha-galactosidase